MTTETPEQTEECEYCGCLPCQCSALADEYYSQQFEESVRRYWDAIEQRDEDDAELRAIFTPGYID